MSARKNKYPEAVKRKAVEDFNSGKKSAQELANELGYKDTNGIYQWKHYFQKTPKEEAFLQKILIGILNFSAVLLSLKWKMRSLRKP